METSTDARVNTRYRVEVIADSTGKWIGNGLDFDTAAAAEEYGSDLQWRWTAVREYRVVEASREGV